MVGALTVASALRGVAGVKVVRRPFEPSEEVAFAASPEPAEDAPVVEGSSFAVHKVSASSVSGFTHFVDGVQKTRLAFYDGQMPGCLAHVAAAVLSRVERDMLDSWAEEVPSLPDVYAPSGSDALSRLSEGFTVRPVECEPEMGMSEMRDRVSAKIGSEREKMEDRLKVKWLREGEGWMLADGSIAQASASEPSRWNIAGVIKSHRKQYFKDTAEIVLNLQEGERSSVFEAQTGRRGQDVAYSWYLRLRDGADESPAFGLIRVEMPPISESIEWADRVSGWLLAERAPLSLPDVRFDRMIYPIRRVELYLKSRQPSDAALTGLVGVW